MGKVFNAESVAREAVPWPGDQERVAREFMDTATNIQGLDAAIIFGSTALGNANRRSDIDVAVAYNDKGDLPAFFTELRDTVQSFPQGELNHSLLATKASPMPKPPFKATSSWQSISA